MFRRLILLVGFVAVFALSAEARATTYGTVRANFWQVNPSSNIEIHYPGGSYSHGGGAGVYRYYIDKSNPPTTWSEMDTFGAGSDEWFPGFCIELRQFTNGWALYDVQDLEGSPVPGGEINDASAALIREFWGRYGPQYGQWDLWTGWNNGNYAEAFQVGIWELIYEDFANGYDVLDTTSDLWVNPVTIQYGAANINAWLTSLDGTGPMADLRAITNSNYQDVIVVVPSVPEPLTMLGVFVGVGGIGVYVRRRRKSA